MQTNSAPGQARNTKRYRVIEQFSGDNVLLEVDLDLLTPARATLINEFWGRGEDRLDTEGGDVVRAVVHLFGMWIMSHMVTQGGAVFDEHTTSPDGDPNPGPLWTADVHDQEGWGGTTSDPFGFCGIRCIAAEVKPITFDDVEILEVEPC